MKIFSHGKAISFLQYFTDSVEDYWHILYPLTDPQERKNDRYLYFYDISKKALDFGGPFDENGIYLFAGYDGGWHLHALEIAQYALASWLAWRKTADSVWLERAMRHCDWLRENQAPDGAWYIEHKNPKYHDLPSPWPSGMAQGLAVSALLRAWRYSGDGSYLTAAAWAADFLERDVEDGGVRRGFEQGFVYEEYPRKKLSGVLNGYITAIFGLWELSEQDGSFGDMFHKNIQNLKKILPLYDMGFWSYYGLDGTVASGFYHRYVITQLRALGELDPFFADYAKRFEAYTKNPFYIAKAVYAKLKR